jgi:hypothetical protein
MDFHFGFAVNSSGFQNRPEKRPQKRLAAFLETFRCRRHFVVMRQHVREMRELLSAARLLRDSARWALEQSHIQNLLRAAEELENHARLLASALPDETINFREEEVLHSPVDMRV